MLDDPAIELLLEMQQFGSTLKRSSALAQFAMQHFNVRRLRTPALRALCLGCEDEQAAGPTGPCIQHTVLHNTKQYGPLNDSKCLYIKTISSRCNRLENVYNSGSYTCKDCEAI